MIYGSDIKLPGMLNAAIKDCPVFGGKVKSFDAAKVEGMKGVKKVVQVGDSAVAVVADTWWQAKTALDALPIIWDEGENAKVSSASIAEQLKAGLDAEQAFVGNQAGDMKAGLAGAAKKIEAVYAYPFQNHAPMEPMNATVRYTPDRCEMWGPTQNGEGAFAAIQAASGLPADKIDVHNTMLGGGFGRRGSYPNDYVTQAVLIAKQMPGVPVKMIWSREEDMQHGRYHPVMQCKLVGGLDASGNLSALHMRLSGQSILAAVRPEVLAAQKGRDPLAFQGVFESGEHSLNYTVPNLLVDHAMRNTHVPPGFWRGVNINQNAVFLECFMDELADAGGKDPLEFRAEPARQEPARHGRAERGGAEDRLVEAGAERRLPRHGADEGVRQLRRRGLRDLGDRRQQGQGAAHRRGDRSGLCRQPGADRAPGGRLVRLRPVGAVHAGVHGEGRPHRADQLPRLPVDAHRADAAGRDHHPAYRRHGVGRHRRAHHLRRRAGGDERDRRATGKRYRSVPLKNHGLEMV